MLELSPATLVLVLAVGVYTAAAAFWDAHAKRIPNKLTLPMFFGGWIYQFIVSYLYGWQHLGNAALGFLVGFGLLFVLWFVGGGGGGDVKLMGALSVWLGFKLTLWVLFISTLLVLLATVSVVIWNITSQGFHKTRNRYLATAKNTSNKNPETRDSKLQRRVMAFAGPVAVATWVVVLWNLPLLERSLKPSQVTASTSASASAEGT